MDFIEKPNPKPGPGSIFSNSGNIQKIKVLTGKQIVEKKRHIIPFEGRFLASFGRPERHCKVFVTGPSYSGKSMLIYEYCDECTKHDLRVEYNSYEEGDSQTSADKIIQFGLHENKNFRLIEKAPHELWRQRLLRRQSADVGVMDSVQHAGMSQMQYRNFVDSLCTLKKHKMMVFVSHWVKNPFTLFVKHDADIKIEVIGFIGKVQSRYGGNKPMLIWDKGAKEYWGKRYQQVIAGKYWPGQKK